MSRYLLDNNVVQYFVQAGRGPDLGAAAGHVGLAVSDVVYQEATTGKQAAAGRTALERVPTRSIVVGSDADATLAALSSPLSTRGRGERESIALVLHEPDLIFVTYDKGAMWIALRELHARSEKLLGVPAFLRRMREDAAMALECVDAVMAEHIRQGGKAPTWWVAWRTAA